MFKIHKWVVKDKQILQSPLEQIKSLGLNATGLRYFEVAELTHQPCIVTYKCELTGEEKVERI